MLGAPVYYTILDLGHKIYWNYVVAKFFEIAANNPANTVGELLYPSYRLLYSVSGAS